MEQPIIQLNGYTVPVTIHTSGSTQEFNWQQALCSEALRSTPNWQQAYWDMVCKCEELRNENAALRKQLEDRAI